MSIVVTGATGHLGRLAVEALLSRGVAADQIVATGRRTNTLDDLAAQGVHVRRADFTDPASLREAFAGAEKVLLVSSSEVGQLATQHANAISAAKDAGVSLVRIHQHPQGRHLHAAARRQHKQTEQLLADSGVPHVLLRNGWYVENYTGQLPVYLEHGIAGAAGGGRVSVATRADYAGAAAAVLTSDGHAGKTYELGGPAVTMVELAQVVSDAAGQQVTYHDMPVEQYTQVLIGAGLPEPVAAVFADGDRGVADGELFVDPTDLEQLLGTPATPLADAVRDAVKTLQG